jgi:hypothetical protein
VAWIPSASNRGETSDRSWPAGASGTGSALLRNRAFIEDDVRVRDTWREGNLVAFPPGTYWLRRFANVIVAET